MTTICSGNLATKAGVSYSYAAQSSSCAEGALPVATLNVTTPGVHVVNIWAREDGMYIDKIVLTTSSSYTPSGTGPVESVRGPVYVYDGNGNRVQAVEAGAVTAYVGSWYESITTPTGTTMKRYYYAGSMRIAMREGAGADASNLTFLFGDHLGSTSVSYKADQSLTKTQLYKVWGENRWPTTSELPTTYRFTGQRAETSLGIYFYNARWYDQWTGRFLQADTVIPDPGNPLDWDRYAYARNNALRYTDPTGHEVCDEDGNCYEQGRQTKSQRYFMNNWSWEENFGITFDGEGWTEAQKNAVKAAVVRVGTMLANGGDAEKAFRDAYGYVNFTLGDAHAQGECIGVTGGACTTGAHQINIWGLTGEGAGDVYDRGVKNVVHELGHAFNNSFGKACPACDPRDSPHAMTSEMAQDREKYLHPNPYPKRLDWQQHPDSTSPREVFAEMFIAMAYDTWNPDPANQDYVQAAKTWMGNWVP